MSENTNCLQDMACPSCGSQEPFRIVATCFVDVYDDGTDNPTDLEWDQYAYCMCIACLHEGVVGNFINP